MSDEKAMEVENVLKDTLTPYILLLIQDVNNYLKQNGFPFMMIVVGGDAIAKFFPNDKKLESHDFDIRLSPLIGFENKPGLKELQMKLSILISKYFELRLNSYTKKIIPQLRRKLQSEFDNFLKGIKTTDGKIFTANRTARGDKGFISVPVDTPVSLSRSGDLFTMNYTLKFGDRLLTDSLIDIFAERPDSITFPYEEHVNIYNQNDPKTFTPYIDIQGVPYASLGYVLWDTLRLIKYGEERNYPKLPRYRMKLDQIIRGLYKPENSLSCLAMKEFVDGCVQNRKTDCKVGNKVLDKNELVDYGVQQGFIPPQLSDKFKKAFSKEYMCNYIKQLQTETDQIMGT